MPVENDAMQDLEREIASYEAQARSSDSEGTVSMDLDLDLSDVSGFGVLDSGLYPATVEKVTPKKSSKNPENHYLEFEFKISHGPASGRKIWDRVMLFGNAKQRFAIFTDALGMYDKVNKKFRGNITDFVGKALWLNLEVEAERKSDDGSKTYPARNTVAAWTGFEPITAHPLPTDRNSVIDSELGDLGESVFGDNALSAALAVEEKKNSKPVAAVSPAVSPAAAAVAGASAESAFADGSGDGEDDGDEDEDEAELERQLAAKKAAKEAKRMAAAKTSKSSSADPGVGADTKDFALLEQ